jgi:hypothetical protein
VRLSARGRITVTASGATAAYTLDPDCAEAQVEGQSVVVAGVRPCTTYLIIVSGNETRSVQVFVSASQLQLERMRLARLSSEGIQESGSVGTSFSSDRDELETSIDMARTVGDHSTTVALSVANGYAYSASDRRTVLSHASVRFKGPSSSVTLLDGYAPESPTIVGDSQIRGLHLETTNWFLHGGIASLTNFREYLVEPDPDSMIVAGYRRVLSKRASLMTDVQWISASSKYLSGQSGTVGSMLFRYEIPSRLRFQAEAAAGQGWGFGSSAEYTGDRNHLDLRIRSTSAHFASLSISPARGLQSSGSWLRPVNEKLSNELSGGRNSLTRFDGGQDTNSSLNDRLQRRIDRFTFSSGVAFTDFSHRKVTTFRSLTFPLGFGYEKPSFGNSFQYQVGRTWGADHGSQWLSDSVRLSFKSLSLRVYGGRQTETPSLSYILANLPLWLQNALLSAGVSITSPEQIQEFLSTHSELIAGGNISDFNVNTSPLRRYAGGSLQWSSPRKHLSARLESRIDDDTRIANHVTFLEHTFSLSSQFAQNQLLVGASFFQTELAGKTVRVPNVSFGIQHQLRHVPDILTRLQERGFIRGVVYSDKERAATYLTGDHGIERVLVTLDGTRRTYTNRAGWYSFGAVSPGRHIVEIQYQSEQAFVFTTLPHVEVPADSIVNFGIATRAIELFGTVRSDAGRGIGGVVVRTSGANEQTAETLPSGTFVFHPQQSGEVKVLLDVNSLPPGYALNELREQTVAVDPDHPGHADFVVRALHSFAGKIDCSTGKITWDDLHLTLDGKLIDHPFDSNGNYLVRDLAVGTHDLVIGYRSLVYHQSVEVGAEPNILRGEDLDICTPPLRP